MSQVKLTGRAGAVLIKDGRTMALDGELMASGDEWILYSSSVGLWSDGSEATGIEKQAVIREVVDLLVKEGLHVIVE